MMIPFLMVSIDKTGAIFVVSESKYTANTATSVEGQDSQGVIKRSNLT